ncbi:MAG: DUF1501 domain-containing protein [Acidimicrobiales bacterium]
MSNPPLPRRRFLTLAGGTAGALALGACSWSDGVRESVANTSTTVAPTTTGVAAVPPSGRPLLVVVNMAGGNDALNTVVPLSGRYHDLRPAIALDDAELLPLTEGYALHPSLEPLMPWWDTGSLAAVYGLGIPGQSRSHFAATDAWSAASSDYSPTGWLGRWLDQHDQAGTDPLLAVGLGGGRATVTGHTASSTVINRPEQFLLEAAPGMDADALADVLLATARPSSGDSDALAMVRAGIPRATNAVQILTEIADDADLVGIAGDTATTLMRVAARILALNLSTEVITVNIGGFDTHANQINTHADVLADLAAGIAAFHEEVDAAGVDRDVLIMSTSEFGRRAADNGSGTDHGAAGVQFLIGGAVNGGQIIGDPGLDRLIDGDLPFSIDTRSFYGAALEHLGGDPASILGSTYEELGII